LFKSEDDEVANAAPEDIVDNNYIVNCISSQNGTNYSDVVSAINETEQDEITFKKPRFVKRSANNIANDSEGKGQQNANESIENDCVKALTQRLRKLEREQAKSYKYQSFNNKVFLIFSIFLLFLYILIIIDVKSFHRNMLIKYDVVTIAFNNLTDNYESFYCCVNKKMNAINNFLIYNCSTLF